MGRRALPECEKKKSHHFKLSPDHINQISKRSKQLGVNKTKYVELLLEKDRKRPFKKV